MEDDRTGKEISDVDCLKRDDGPSNLSALEARGPCIASDRMCQKDNVEVASIEPSSTTAAIAPSSSHDTSKAGGGGPPRVVSFLRDSAGILAALPPKPHRNRRKRETPMAEANAQMRRSQKRAKRRHTKLSSEAKAARDHLVVKPCGDDEKKDQSFSRSRSRSTTRDSQQPSQQREPTIANAQDTKGQQKSTQNAHTREAPQPAAPQVPSEVPNREFGGAVRTSNASSLYPLVVTPPGVAPSSLQPLHSRSFQQVPFNHLETSQPAAHEDTPSWKKRSFILARADDTAIAPVSSNNRRRSPKPKVGSRDVSPCTSIPEMSAQVRRRREQGETRQESSLEKPASGCGGAISEKRRRVSQTGNSNETKEDVNKAKDHRTRQSARMVTFMDNEMEGPVSTVKRRAQKRRRGEETGHPVVPLSQSRVVTGKKAPSFPSAESGWTVSSGAPTPASFPDMYREVFLKSQVAQLIASPGGKIVACNESFLRSSGIDHETMCQYVTVFSLVRPDVIPRLCQIFSLALREVVVPKATASVNSSQSASSSLRSNVPSSDAVQQTATMVDTKVPAASSGASIAPSLGGSPSRQERSHSASRDVEDDTSSDNAGIVSVTLPFVGYQPGVAESNLKMTVSLMNDVDPTKRCFLCMVSPKTPIGWVRRSDMSLGRCTEGVNVDSVSREDAKAKNGDANDPCADTGDGDEARIRIISLPNLATFLCDKEEEEEDG